MQRDTGINGRARTTFLDAVGAVALVYMNGYSSRHLAPKSLPMPGERGRTSRHQDTNPLPYHHPSHQAVLCCYAFSSRLNVCKPVTLYIVRVSSRCGLQPLWGFNNQNGWCIVYKTLAATIK